MSASRSGATRRNGSWVSRRAPRPAMAEGGSLPKAQITRRLILEAAAALFREKGYAEVSLREIAQAAGMKTGSLYYHFESKESLVEEFPSGGGGGPLGPPGEGGAALARAAD